MTKWLKKKTSKLCSVYLIEMYYLLIDLNVVKGSADVEMLGLILDNTLEFWKTYCKIMPNSVIQTPGTQANKKILNIRKSQSLGKCFCGFSI